MANLLRSRFQKNKHKQIDHDESNLEIRQVLTVLLNLAEDLCWYRQL